MIDLIRAFLKEQGLPVNPDEAFKDWFAFESHAKVMLGVSGSEYFEALCHIDNLKALLARFARAVEEAVEEVVSPEDEVKATSDEVKDEDPPLKAASEPETTGSDVQTEGILTGLDTGEGKVEAPVDPTTDSSLSA